MRVDETWHRLYVWTQGQPASERLAALVLDEEGYESIDPTHPLGGPDGGKDGRVVKGGEPWILAVYFPREQQSPREVKDKFVSDYDGATANEAEGMAFVTNQELREAERIELRNAVDGPCDIYHLERLVSILDRPRMAQVREQFLDIQAAPAVGLDRTERLGEMLRSSQARCAARWQAAGLNSTLARELAQDRGLGAVEGSLLPSDQRRLVIWSAVMGAGKSISCERFHQQAIETALASEEAPLPAYIDAKQAQVDLATAVASEASELGEPRRQGATVIVDGLDEIDPAEVEAVIGQGRELVASWPQTSVVMATRPIGTVAGLEETLQIPELADDQTEWCVEIASGGLDNVRLTAFSSEVRTTLKRPLFALLAGKWIREHHGIPTAPIDLLTELGQRAEGELRGDPVQLRQLAAESVRRGLGPVPEADVGGREEVESLLATGLMTQRSRGLVFTLPAIAQWLAAQAILREEIDLSKLMEAPEDLELWRPPLAVAIALGTADAALRVLQHLLEAETGFAFRVLNESFTQVVYGGHKAPPWRQAGAEIRAATEALAEALGPLAPLVVETDADSRLLPLGVATKGERVEVGVYRGADAPSDDYFRLPPDLHVFNAGPDWGSIRFASVAPGASWAWQWAVSTIDAHLKQVVSGRTLPIPPEGPLAAEEAWTCATDLMKASILRADVLPLDDLIARAEAIEVDAGPDAQSIVYAREGHRSHDLAAVLAYLRRERDAGATELRAPLPASDREPGGGWIGEFYTPARLVEIARQMYEQALIGYRQLVERWFPAVASQLEHYALMPVRVHGFVDPGTAHDYGPIPQLAGYLEALAPGSRDEVAMTADQDFDWEIVRHVARQQRDARPTAARWISGTVGGMTFNVGKRTPVFDVVYGWLLRDLHRLGLVKGVLSHSEASRDVHTPWEAQ